MASDDTGVEWLESEDVPEPAGDGSPFDNLLKMYPQIVAEVADEGHG